MAFRTTTIVLLCTYFLLATCADAQNADNREGQAHTESERKQHDESQHDQVGGNQDGPISDGSDSTSAADTNQAESIEAEFPNPSYPSDRPDPDNLAPNEPDTAAATDDVFEPTFLVTGAVYNEEEDNEEMTPDEEEEEEDDDDEDDFEDKIDGQDGGFASAASTSQDSALESDASGQQSNVEDPSSPDNSPDDSGGIGFKPTVVAAIVQETSIEDALGGDDGVAGGLYEGDYDDEDDEEQKTEQAAPKAIVRENPALEIQGDKLADEAELMINRSRNAGTGSGITGSNTVGQSTMKAAYKLLEEATAMGSMKAGELAGFAYLFGDYLPWNPRRARAIFEDLALRGSPRGQLGLGFMYASGIAVNSSQAKALVYFTFSGLGGDSWAQMALAYRYWSGINLPQSCESALTYYRRVAENVASEVSSGIGGTSVARIRLSDEGAETSGKEGSGSGTTASSSSSSLMDNDLLQYYRFLADKGDIQAQVGLGQLYLTGGRGLEQNLDQAFYYFSTAAEAGNSNAYAYLGKLYLEGTPSLKADNRTALEYFKRAADKGNPVGQSGLGLMYLYGRGVDMDTAKAIKYFQLAADQGWVDGQLQLGTIYFSGAGGVVRRDYKLAIKYFQLASQSGHVLALYNLAQMHATGTGLMRSCQTATELYKNVAERGKWSEMLMQAHSAYREGRADQAALKYLFLAELGYEVAQSNFAYLLDRGHLSMFEDTTESYERSLVHWERAADQGSGLARLKLGDYHYYGRGTPIDYTAAVHHYKIASEQQHNAQAMFNLAYMHEQGLGIKRDIHLAKRFYDLAAETSSDAAIPVALALGKLALFFAFQYFTKGGSGAIMPGGGEGATSIPRQTITGSSGTPTTSTTGARSPLASWWSLETFDEVFGPDWDIYVISALCGLLVVLVYLRNFR